MHHTRRLLDELALAGPEHLDPAYVERYDAKARTDPSEDLAGLVALGLGRDSTVVELGAGTGTFALAAAPLAKRVIAVDISPAMIVAIQIKAASSGVENVECVQAGFLSYEHGGALADFVYTRNAFHHLPDFWKAIALRRIAGFLRAGGVLRLRDLVFSFELDDADTFIAEWLDSAPERPDDGWTRDELEVHLREEFSTFTWLLEPMIQRAGFEIEEADYSGLRVHADYICRKRSG